MHGCTPVMHVFLDCLEVERGGRLLTSIEQQSIIGLPQTESGYASSIKHGPSDPERMIPCWPNPDKR